MCETCRHLGSAIEDGRIGVGAIDKWRRAFESAPELAREALESQRPDQHRRLENHHALVTARHADLDDRLVDVHERELASRLGIRPEDVI